jgi:hypothetical protein
LHWKSSWSLHDYRVELSWASRVHSEHDGIVENDDDNGDDDNGDDDNDDDDNDDW